jgi:transposase
VEGAAERLRLGLDVPSPISEVGEPRRVRGDPSRVAEVLRRQTRHRLEMEFPGQRLGEGAKRGDLTGPNPTDRAKSGVKRHILTDARGVPIAALITGANVPDAAMINEVLDAVAIRGPRGPRRPEHLCLDKGYDYPHVAPAIRLRGIKPHIRRRGEQPLVGRVRGKARRWVVERTNSWHNRFRGLLVRWERRGAHYLALLQLACGLIAFQQAT